VPEILEFEDVPYPYAEKSVVAAGVGCVYVDEGEGKRPVVFLPAAGRSLTHDAKLFPELRASGERVVGVDLPGWGKSEKPDATYSVEWYAHWVEHFLRAIGVERCVLVGSSLGGLIAGLLASRHPQLVAGAALVAPAGGPVSFVKRSVAKLFLDEKVLLHPSERAVRSGIGQYFHKPVPELEVIVQRALAVSRGKGWPAYVRAVSRGGRSAIETDLVPHLATVACPVLLVWGREDRVCPVEWADLFAKHIARARVRVLEGCGHFPSIERSADVARELVAWLREEVKP
jgi:4,5:9,10-diseco-3-hydroxy-5,9,17-trioxoandrosta-1(10),2-diene-4-oate hydrolase